MKMQPVLCMFPQYQNIICMYSMKETRDKTKAAAAAMTIDGDKIRRTVFLHT